uniref:IS701 family transposase n=1 Tax=Streptomyces omiyaensis TaxID=68247 RepID=UPI001671D4D7|nr:IS701 family transposase [Streptomyces omiyaensis]
MPRRDQRRWGGCYLRGLVPDARRKSVRPMAERLPDGNTQAPQQFVNQSPWDPLPVRRRIAERLSEAITPEVWVNDDVSFPQCGTASVGVARRYCGALGKRANCQVAVSVHAATDAASRPLDWQLYLPREWTDEPDRCRRAGVPDEAVARREKRRLALGMPGTLAGWELEAPVVVADAGYGVSTPFRTGLEERGRSYVLALNGKEVAHAGQAEPHRPAYGGLGPPALTVRPAGKQSLAAAQTAGGGRNRWDGILPARTLLAEWPHGQDAPTGHWISNLPATVPVADLVRWVKMRWRIEHDYRELKHGLGLDHFEGRTRRGWHHHATLVTAAQAFLALRRLDPKAHTPT